jgi:hypothetical protein
MLLLKEWFSEARPSFIEDYLKGIEKFVKVKGKDFVFAGRVDALYGNVIIEFESNIGLAARSGQAASGERHLKVQEKAPSLLCASRIP